MTRAQVVLARLARRALVPAGAASGSICCGCSARRSRPGIKSCRRCCFSCSLSSHCSACCSSSRAFWPSPLKPKVPALPASLCSWSRRLLSRCCWLSTSSACCSCRALPASSGNSCCRRWANCSPSCCRWACSCCSCCWRLSMGTVPDGADLRRQLHGVERLDDHVGGSQAAVMSDLAGLHLGGHKGHGDQADVHQFAEFCQGLRAIHVRHHHIQQDKVGGEAQHLVQGFLTGGAAEHAESAHGLQGNLGHCLDRGVIFHMQNTFEFRHRACPWSAGWHGGGPSVAHRTCIWPARCAAAGGQWSGQSLGQNGGG